MLITLVLACMVFDDGSGEYGVGGNLVGIKGNRSIRMISEFVHAKLPECRVHASFAFRNEGPATTVLMMFPEEGGYARYTEKSDPEARRKTHFEYFRSWVDGKRVVVRRKLRDRSFGDGYYYTNWWVKSVHFDANQTRTVVDEYQGEEGWAGTGEPNTSTFEYTVGTGASWKGAIGSGTIEVDCKDLMKGYDIEGRIAREMLKDTDIEPQKGIFVWYFKDLKPRRKDGMQIEWTKKGLPKEPPPN